MLITSLVVIGIILAFISILSIADNLISIEAQKHGIDPDKSNLGLFPSVRDLFSKSAPGFVSGGQLVNLKKGHDIKLAGNPVSEVVPATAVTRVAIKPQDYRGIAPIPKMEVQVGDEVKAGQAIFFDKKNSDINFVSPVSGEVVEIRRGAKRAITHVVILADKEQSYHQFTPPSAGNSNPQEIIEFLKKSGAWTLINQRPFDILANSELVPENIFISTFDSSPLALDYNIALEGREEEFQKGLDVLGRLTTGKVYLGLDARGNEPAAAFTEATGVVKTWFRGKHPVGNVGVQIHHTNPIKSNKIVWTLDPQDVALIGRLFISGTYDGSRVVSVGGGQVLSPSHVKTYKGASIDELLKGNLSDEGTSRIIGGNVLSGSQVGADDFLSQQHNSISVIKEGDQYELFGWLLPITPRPSVSRTFPNFLIPNHEFEANTNTHGEQRAFVVTGQYENMLPMDIYPQHLMKAIMAGDIERMEGLGINELTEEDVALCEFSCTSKQPLQSILREGLDMMREQG